MSYFTIKRSGLKRQLIIYAVSLAICAVILIISSIIVYSLKDPDAAVGVSSHAALIVSCAVCGYVSSKLSGKMISGLITGALIVTTLFMLSLIFFERSESAGTTFALYGASILCSAIAGVIASTKPRKRHSRRKYPRRKR